MRIAALFLFLLLPAVGHAELAAWSPETRSAWWTANASPADWVRESGKLRTELVRMQAANGTSWAMNNPDFRKWLGHAWWLLLFPAEWVTHPRFSRPEVRSAYATLGQDENLPWRFLAALHARDDAGEALGVLCELAAADLAACRAYPALAIATAVVWDQPLPEAWPHPFVTRARVPLGRESAVERFQFFVDAHRAGRLLVDPRTLSVNDLCFVVSNPLRFEQLVYGQSFKVRNPDQLYDLYKAVQYDHTRVKHARPDWNSGDYLLQSIWKQGGICADQAYLASNVFQAKGIPSILFLGQGTSGDHAWVGYRKLDGSWVLNIARYRSHNYPVGQAVHPQTRLRISDVDLAVFAKQLDQSASWYRTRIFLGWARLNPDEPFYGELIMGARRLLPDLPETWDLEAAWHEHNGSTPQRRAEFYRRWIDHFDLEEAMKFRGQLALYRLYESHDLHAEAARLKATILRETRDKRFDLGIHLASEGVFRFVEQGDWKNAHDEFERTMKDFHGQAGGHLFYGLLQPYVTACLEDREIRLARDAMQHARRFDLRRTTILSNDIRELALRVNAAD